VIDSYNEYMNAINMNLREHLSLLPIMWYYPIHEATVQTKNKTLLKLYCFMSLYFMTYASITEAMQTLTEEIQAFLLNIGQEEYMLTLINGLRWQLKMTPNSIRILKDYKHPGNGVFRLSLMLDWTFSVNASGTTSLDSISIHCAS
jgi:hypothetical protein